LYDPDLPHRLIGESLLGIPVLSYSPGNLSAGGLLYKRALDVIGGVAGCMLLALMYPIVALTIKMDSPGPVLFKQVRIGRNGRQFYLYKFRTMVVDAEKKKSELLKYNEMKGPIFKVADDPRITKVGRFLRKTSLDEFPQFINVLKGEMSLVGTRPPTPNEVNEYEDWHRRRISATPGITGLWQVSGRNKITDFVEVVKLDLEYIDTWRFARDIWILWRTIWVVLERKGAK
jgi:exopolysaccharide biosynthesis polyprenyl glycosylphosphotransferase